MDVGKMVEDYNVDPDVKKGPSLYEVSSDNALKTGNKKITKEWTRCSQHRIHTRKKVPPLSICLIRCA
jgi:hypothetical protein